MTPERWQQIEDIFQAVVDLSPAERLSYLKENYSDDAELIAEIERLIADYEQAGDFIESPVWTDSFMLGKSFRNQIGDALGEEIKQDNGSMIGKHLGVYRLTKELGRGGMGAVYLAERADGEFRQRVALKVIKRGMDTDFIVRRFRNERQILATLDHPNIARLLDGGTTQDGLPFFVMEYIEGKPVYRYSDAHKLTISERLHLFRRICAAVDYAHRNLIIHRDIKPSNIMITASGTPKLLDFGIAKILNPELAADSIDPTATAMRMMTPEYASPEQVRGEPVTKVSDIYSLGVLLYELLTGHRPYRLKNRALHEIARVICEEEPEKLGASITREDNIVPTDGNEEPTTLEFIFQNRNASRDSLRRELSGDLEKIVRKALRKEPGERYQTAAEFADDILRYLEHRPVLAETFQAVSPVKIYKPAAKTNPDEISVAVLPLKLFGAQTREDTGDEYLCIGLADALITRLSNVRRFTVRPTSSVLRFGADSNPFDAGHELNVEYVIDGNIRRVGDVLRVTVQLLNIYDGATGWARRFDEKITDFLTLEDTISEKIAEALLSRLSGEEQKQIAKRGTNNAQAHEAYLRGRFYWNQFTPDSLPKSLESFQTAVRLDPDYALAYVGLADFYIWANIYGIIPSSVAVGQAETAALRALEIDDTLGEAYASFGLTRSNRRDWTEAERLYRKAIELTPNYVHAREWLAALLVGTGRAEEGVKEIKIAEQLDLLSLRTKSLTAWTLTQAGQFEEAFERGKLIIELDKNYPQGYAQTGLALLGLGRAAEALEYLRKFDEMIPDSALAKYQFCCALVAAGNRAGARKVLEEIKTLAKTGYVKPYFLAVAHLALGETDAAAALLEQSLAESDPWLLWFGTEPMFEEFRQDPQYFALFNRMNNPLALRQAADSPPKTSGEKTIAVLPFKILQTATGSLADNDFLGLGLADALIMRLSSINRLIVRPTSSVIRYGTTTTDPFLAAREIDVQFVVDGHVKRVNDKIRVSIQLLNVAEQTAIWAKSFDEEFTDVLTLEDSISEQIAKALLPQLTDTERENLGKRPTDNPEAFEAYLRGRYFWTLFTKEGLQKALACYQQAISYDPNYALAYAGIADYFNWLSVYALMPSTEASAKAKEAAQKAIQLDDKLAAGYAALGFATLIHDLDWRKAEEYLAKAVELNPNYVVGRVWYSYFLGMQKRFDEAFAQINQALKLDPLTPIVPQTYNWMLYYAGRFEESVAATRRLTEREPNYGLSFIFFTAALASVGEFEEAVKIGERAVELLGRSPYTLSWLAAAYAAAGNAEKTYELLDEIEERAKTHYASPCLIAMVHVNLDEKEKALELIEKAVEIKDARIAWLYVDPRFEPLRDEPRFKKLLKKTNNPAIEI